MKIGIIGAGVVGNACKQGFTLLGHKVIVHDIKYKTDIKSLKKTEIIYICVPTHKGNKYTDKIIKNVLKDLQKISFDGIIAIKSTLVPGTTEKLIKETNLNICFVPEFLREVHAEKDFIINHNLLAIGCHRKEIFKKIVASHGFLPKNIVSLTPTEAEILKYYSNVYNATKIVFANSMYEICKKLNSNYSKIKDTYILRGTPTSDYLEVNKNLRGYGGTCLPKDVKSFNKLTKQLGLNISLFKAVDKDNKKFK